LRDLRTDYGTLAFLCLEAGDLPGVASAIERLPELFPRSLDDHLMAAAYLARCSALASRDEPARSYADRAVGWLRQAARRRLLTGPSDLDREEFAPLRGRADFRRLRAEVAAGSGPFSG
jgi:hypothetical protein